MVEFREWPKIPRGQNETITITEKIDGTNACVIVEAWGDGDYGFRVTGCQSRKRLITPEDDNYGFAKWVDQNRNGLQSLGEGYHYGEWAGPGIQGNPHKLDRKRFFLFNTDRWRDDRQERPQCCDVVPILYEGPHDQFIIEETLNDTLFGKALEENYTPEGIVVWYHKTRRYEKYTFRNQEGKWKNESQ